jgi:hypothetical protein
MQPDIANKNQASEALNFATCAVARARDRENTRGLFERWAAAAFSLRQPTQLSLAASGFVFTGKAAAWNLTHTHTRRLCAPHNGTESE